MSGISGVQEKGQEEETRADCVDPTSQWDKKNSDNEERQEDNEENQEEDEA